MSASKNCGHVINAASVAAEAARRAALTESAALIEERTHRGKHGGQLPGRVKLSHVLYFIKTVFCGKRVRLISRFF